jgi:hypothetical protein
MPAPALTAITALEVISFHKNHEAVFVIKIFALLQEIVRAVF